MVLFKGHVIFRGKSIIDGIRYGQCVEPLQCTWRNMAAGNRYHIGGILFSSPLEVYWQFFSSSGYSHLVSGWAWPIPSSGCGGVFPVYRLKPPPPASTDKGCGSPTPSSSRVLLQEFNGNSYTKLFRSRPVLSAGALFLDKC